jgi:hypothetical protein
MIDVEHAGETPPLWTLIVPCAAPIGDHQSPRPKWLLTTPDGELLVMRAIAAVPPHAIGRIVVAFLREAEERYHCAEALRRASDGRIECMILDNPTDGPAQTVRQVIQRANVQGPVCIKDGSSFFDVSDLPAASFLAISDIRKLPWLSSPGRKSYVRLNEQGIICEVVEKEVRSNLVSVGLYGFASAATYLREFDRLARTTGHPPVFVSNVAASAILHGEIFLPHFCDNLADITTRSDWRRYRASMATLVLDIDGVIFRNQSKFFSPFWGEPVEPITKNVAHLLNLQRAGAQLVFMTARPEQYRAITMESLQRLGFVVHGLVMGCFHATRYLVNDFALSNPFPAAVAINVPRNTDQLNQLLLPDHLNLDQDI